MIFFLCACTSNTEQKINASPTRSAPTTSAPIQSEKIDSVDVTPTQSTQIETLKRQADTPTPNISVQIDEILQVIVFDVGQADCILVKAGEHSMLVDAGDIGQDSLILSYLSDNGVTKLDYLVATHPHADHIGSMAAVVRGMDSIGTLLMPDVTHTTQTFENLLDAIEEKDVYVSIPQTGDMFEMGNVRIKVVSPNSDSYSDLNNYSIVLLVEYGQSVFLLTGDAEDISENEQLEKGFIYSADVLKVGHHGSSSSTTEQYLDAVSPSYAVISCGKDNLYGHPHNETLSRLVDGGVTIYRTDENGSVTFTTDGSTITTSVEREGNADNKTAVSSENALENVVSYIGNVNSKKFHLPTCGTLPAEKNRIHFTTRDEAITKKFQPCKNCNP